MATPRSVSSTTHKLGSPIRIEAMPTLEEVQCDDVLFYFLTAAWDRVRVKTIVATGGCGDEELHDRVLEAWNEFVEQLEKYDYDPETGLHVESDDQRLRWVEPYKKLYALCKTLSYFWVDDPDVVAHLVIEFATGKWFGERRL